MRVLITGVAGFIGSHTAEVLRNGKHQVMGVDDFSTGRPENLYNFVEAGGRYVTADITLPSILEIFQNFKPEVVIHLAAQAAITTSMDNPDKDLKVNGMGTIRLVQAAKKFGVKRFIFSSTSAVYREQHVLWNTGEKTAFGPTSPYGISKMAAEFYVRSLFPNSVILRYGNVYGPRQVPIGENQVIPRMISHLQFGDRFYIHGSGEQKRDFVYVSDVAKANTYAITGEPGTYNIASGSCVSVNDIASIIETIYEIPGYKWDHTEVEDVRRKVCLDISAAKKKLYWKPEVNIREGLMRTVGYWKGKDQ